MVDIKDIYINFCLCMSWLFLSSQFLRIHQRIAWGQLLDELSCSFDPSEDPSSGHIPPLPATSQFLSSTDDSLDNDIPDTPPSPTLGTPFSETTLYTQRSPTTSETSSGSSTDALSDSASSRSSSDHSLPASPSGTRSSHRLSSLRSRSPVASVPLSSPTLGALSYARANLLPFPKSIRSPETTMDLEDYSEDGFEPYVPREVRLEVDFKDESIEPSRSRGADLEMDVDVERIDGIEIDPEIQAEIDECFAYEDALRDRGIDVRVIVEAIDREEIEMGMRDPVEVRVDRVTHPVVADDIPEPAQEGAIEVTYETLGDLVQRFHDRTEEIPVHRIQAIESIQRDQGHQIVATGHQSADMLERIQELEQDNRRLRDIVDVERLLGLRLVPGGIWVTILRLFHDYPSIDSTMPNTRSGASRTREGVNKQSDRRMVETLRVRDAVKNLGPLMGNEGEQEEVNGNGENRDGGNGNEGNGNEGNGNRGNRNGGNGNRGNRNKGNGNGGNGNGGNRNGGNGNGNENGGEYGYNFRGFMLARECTYQDFLKCQPLNFNGMEGVVGLTRWFEKIETVFHISNCLEKYQAELMKLMTEVYCPRNEVQKMETELWNLAMKGNDLTAYTRRFQELVLLCTRMVPTEEDKVERFIGGLPDNIQGYVITVESTKLQDAIRVANNLMDQKLKGYARSAENKRRKDYPKLRNQNRGNKTGNKTGNKNVNKTRNQAGSNEATEKSYAIG
ncbi:putative reverse transcriptase domain-containing protein [Tanacetum coccineum]|uniref:Reverse transcriptase domain-containing protein n=1 Tax=Tanacetum coccineum TaxID=301880 RepID=A0ABQ5HNL1_9ASTR